MVVHRLCLCGLQLVSQPPVIEEARGGVGVDNKALMRAEAALTQLLVGDQCDTDVTLSTTLMSSIDTFHNKLLATPDQFTDDDDLQRILMVCSHFLLSVGSHLLAVH